MGCLSGGFGRIPPETIGDSRTEFNRFYAHSKSEAAIIIKKLRCRYVEVDYRQSSRGLSATDELLVDLCYAFLGHYSICIVRACIIDALSRCGNKTSAAKKSIITVYSTVVGPTNCL